eukprot:scaffold10551_cov63-Cylindrotheca_fusiformis.AAC.1
MHDQKQNPTVHRCHWVVDIFTNKRKVLLGEKRAKSLMDNSLELAEEDIITQRSQKPEDGYRWVLQCESPRFYFPH